MHNQDMTDEEKAELSLLCLANEKRKFAIRLHAEFNEHGVEAFDRGAGVWFNLIDVSPVLIAGQYEVCRIFRLTEAGLARLAILSAKQGPLQ